MTATGCGDEKAPTDDNRLSKAEFTAQGARICREGATEIKRLVQRELAKPEVRRLTKTQQTFAALAASESTTRRMFGRLRELEAPAEVEADVRTMTDDVLRFFPLLKELSRLDQQRDSARISQLTTRAATLVGSSRSAAEKAGLTACLPENTP